MERENNALTIGKIGKRLGYGIGDFGINMIWGVISAFTIFYYTDVAGISATVVGTIMLISRILDGISDVVMGVIIDKTKSKYGKARPWLMRMLIPLMAAYVLMFTVPNIGMTGKIIYVFISYNMLTTVFYTAATIPYNTMLSLVTRSQYERSILNIFRMFFAFTGSIIVTMVTQPMVQMFGGDALAWTKTTFCFSLVFAVCYVIVFSSQKEIVTTTANKRETVPVKKGLASLFQNKYWVIMLCVCTLTMLASGLQGAGIYYAKYYLGDANLLGVLSMFGMVPMLVGMIILPVFLKRYGKRNSAMIGCLIAVTGYVIMGISGTNTTTVMAGLVIKAFGSCAMIGTQFAFINDTVEYGEWKTGLRTEGLINSAASFGIKVGTGVGSALVGWVLAWTNYQPNLTQQSAEALGGIRSLYIWMPAVIYAGVAGLLWFYKLDKEYDNIMEDLAAREKAVEMIDETV